MHSIHADTKAENGASCSTGSCGCSFVNLGRTERILSLVAGAGLLAAGLRRYASPTGWLLAAIGGGTIFRGVSGHCQAYQWMGISTVEDEDPAAHIHVSELLDEAGEESFPASDPPAVSPPRP